MAWSARSRTLHGLTPPPQEAETLFASGHPARGGNLGMLVSSDGGERLRQLHPERRPVSLVVVSGGELYAFMPGRVCNISRHFAVMARRRIEMRFSPLSEWWLITDTPLTETKRDSHA